MRLIGDDESRIRELFWQVGPDERVMDVGAAEGSWTFPALDAGAEVIAVEPIEELRMMLAEHNAANLTIQPWALYNGGWYPPELQEQILASRQDELLPTKFAMWTTIDAQLVPHLDRIKIDVEGGELGVLEGAVRTLREDRPMVIIEDHTEIYPWVAETESEAKIIALLTDLGYRVQIERHIDTAPDAHRDYIVGWPS